MSSCKTFAELTEQVSDCGIINKLLQCVDFSDNLVPWKHNNASAIIGLTVAMLGIWKKLDPKFFKSLEHNTVVRRRLHTV